MEHRMHSLAEQVFELIERDILNGSYARGEILTESQLCEQLQVSRTPVREALGRLEQEHLLENTPKGLVVTGLSPEDIADIYTLRDRIEGLAARRLAEQATEEQIAELKETLDLQEFYLQRGDNENVKEMDSRFHRIIYRACGSSIFRYILDGVLMRIVKYRKASLTHAGRAYKSLDEHKAIFSAIAAHDGDAAEKSMRAHVNAAYEALHLSGEDNG